MPTNRPLNIIAATDLSAPARQAARRAALLAEEHHASLTLLHTIVTPMLSELRRWLGQDSAPERSLVEHASRELRTLADELAVTHGIAVGPRLSVGRVVEEMREEAQALDSDLLVVGTRGTGLLRSLTVGSTAQRLITKTDRPVLLVRQEPQGAYQRVLVPVDFSVWSAGAVSLARRIAPGAHLVLLHAFEVPFEEKLRFANVDERLISDYRAQAEASAHRHITELAEACGLPSGQWQASVTQGPSALRILEQADSQSCDLIVMGQHGERPLEELLLGSVTQHVLAEASIDVLVSTTHPASPAP